MTKYKVSHLHLIKAPHVPTLGTLTRILDQTLQPGIVMYTHEDGVLCQHKGTTFLLYANLIETAVIDASADVFSSLLPKPVQVTNAKKH